MEDYTYLAVPTLGWDTMPGTDSLLGLYPYTPDKIVTINCNDGKYTGKFIDISDFNSAYFAHGPGQFEWNDKVAIGNFKYGLMHGYGEIYVIFHDSSLLSYSGYWKNGMPNGQGRVRYWNTGLSNDKDKVSISQCSGIFVDGKIRINAMTTKYISV